MPDLLIVPGSPALVRELAPADAASARLLAAARAEAGSCLAPSAECDVVGSRADRWRTERTGSFAAWGAPDVQVGGGNYLAELVARYIYPHMRVVDSRKHLGTLQRSTIVVVDGSAGLTQRAPLSLLPNGAAAHQWCQDLLAGAPVQPLGFDALRAAGVEEPELWLELADLAPSATQRELIDADDALGVGRYVAHWRLP